MAPSRTSEPRRRAVDSTATRPADLPPASRSTSPGLIRSSASTTASRDDGARRPPSPPPAFANRRRYSSTSPSSQTASARAASISLRLRSTCRSRRTTSLSARYWANDRLSRWWADSGVYRRTRLTAMLYVGRKDDVRA